MSIQILWSFRYQLSTFSFLSVLSSSICSAIGCHFGTRHSHHSYMGSIYSRKFQDKSAPLFPVPVSHLTIETLEFLTLLLITDSTSKNSSKEALEQPNMAFRTLSTLTPIHVTTNLQLPPL